MKLQKKFKVEMVLEIPINCEIVASNKNEAVDIALDNTMDYLETNLSDSRKFDEFWEYIVQHKIIKVEQSPE